MPIHPTSIIDPAARLSPSVTIGPYVVIEGAVSIGDDTQILSHTNIQGPTKIGARNRIGPGAFLGFDPQFRGKNDPNTWLIIGDDNIIREGVSLHRSIKPGDGSETSPATRVGSRCYFMANSHAGHDCAISDDVTLANAVLLAGHVTIGNNVFLGGAAGIHQFCRVGRLTIVGGAEILRKDAPPFAAVRYGGLKGYNAVGCKRAGMSRETIHALRAAYHTIHAHRAFADAMAALDPAVAQVPEVKEIIDFAANTKRGITPSVHALSRSHDEADFQ